jgi:hypothetical protein
MAKNIKSEVKVLEPKVEETAVDSKEEYYATIRSSIPYTAEFAVYKHEKSFWVIKEAKLIGEYQTESEAISVAKSFNYSAKSKK